MLDPYHQSEFNNEKEDVVFCHALADTTHAYLVVLMPLLGSEISIPCIIMAAETLSSLLIELCGTGKHLEYLLNETGILERAYIHELGSSLAIFRGYVTIWD